MPTCRPSPWHRALWRHPPRRVVLSWLCLAVLAAGTALHDWAEVEDEDCPPVVADAALQSVEPSWLADSAEEWPPGALATGMKIPDKPLKGQKLKCDKAEDETNINGGCYIAVDRKPPCLPRQFEHDGKCWRPVKLAEQPPTSVGK